MLSGYIRRLLRDQAERQFIDHLVQPRRAGIKHSLSRVIYSPLSVSLHLHDILVGNTPGLNIRTGNRPVNARRRIHAFRVSLAHPVINIRTHIYNVSRTFDKSRIFICPCRILAGIHGIKKVPAQSEQISDHTDTAADIGHPGPIWSRNVTGLLESILILILNNFIKPIPDFTAGIPEATKV